MDQTHKSRAATASAENNTLLVKERNAVFSPPPGVFTSLRGAGPRVAHPGSLLSLLFAPALRSRIVEDGRNTRSAGGKLAYDAAATFLQSMPDDEPLYCDIYLNIIEEIYNND